MINAETNKNYFKIHVNPTVVTPHHEESPEQNKTNYVKPENVENKRKVVDVLRDAARQIIASSIILVIGFLALNWSAYYKIAKSEWENFTGTKEEITQLQDLVEKKPVFYTQQVLKTSSNPEVQKKQIPQLNLEVTPTDSRLIIPRIDQNIPIVRISSEALINRDWNALEKEMQGALQSGVVHYPGTSLPGQTGNIVITGHSSYFPWDPGRFKDVFALLHDVVKGDKIVIYYDQNKYIYEVDDIKVVLPSNIDVLKQTPEDKLTLITCTPVGTNLKRLIITAKPIEINSKKVEEKVIR